PHQVPVNVGHDGLDERAAHLLILERALGDPRSRQQSAAGKVGEGLGLAAVSDAQVVVVALGGCAADVGSRGIGAEDAATIFFIGRTPCAPPSRNNTV